MTGDTHRDDDLEFDDDFVLEDAADGLDDLFDDVDGSNPAQPKRTKSPEDMDEDDVLFQGTSAGNAVFGGGPKFDEEQGSGWMGDQLDAEEIGIPIDDPEPVDDEASAFSRRDPLAADSDDFVLDADEELELITDDSELEVESGDESFVLDEAETGWDQEPLETAAAGTEPAAWAGEEEPAPAAMFEDDWAPVERGLDLEEDASATPAPAAAEDWQEEEQYSEEHPEYAEFAEDYYDDAHASVGAEPEPVVQGPRRTGRVLRFLAGLAAAALILAAGTIVVLEPELLGFKVEPKLVDRVTIARPVVDLRVDPPALPVVTTDPVTTDPVTTDPVTTDPVTTDPVTTDPVITDPVTTDPVTTDPVTTDPVTTDPVTTDPVTTDPVTTDPVTTDPVTTDPAVVTVPTVDPNEGPPPTHVPIGDTLSIGAYQPRDTTDVLPDIGIVPGSNAFAQLKNGNFFIGSVKSVAVDAVTLRIENGEVTFAMKDLVKIAPLASAEYAELARTQSGFVRLTNNNRLVGSILDGVADDHIILEMKSNRVLLPRSAIEEISSSSRTDIRFANDESDEDWVRRLVEEQMNDPANFQQNEGDKGGVRVRLQENK